MAANLMHILYSKPIADFCEVLRSDARFSWIIEKKLLDYVDLMVQNLFVMCYTLICMKIYRHDKMPEQDAAKRHPILA